MSHKHPSSDLLQLYDAVLSQRADESEIRRLEQLLDEDAEVRNHFAEISLLDVDMRYTFRTGALEPNNLEPNNHVEQTDLAHATASSIPMASWRPRPTATQLGIGLLAIATAVAIAASTMLLPPAPAKIEAVAFTTPAVELTRTSKPPAPVATLTSLQSAEWNGQPLLLGQAIREGESLRLSSGEARISVGYGAEIAATGPCAITFVARDRVQLEYGDVAVHVAEWAKGFTVVTDAMEVVDLGTTFTVSATKGAGARTNVLKGLVRVHPKLADNHGRRGVLVSEGRGFTVDKQGHRDSFKAPPKQSLEELDLDALAPYRPIALHNTGAGDVNIGLSEGDEDPNWRVVAGPVSCFNRSQYAVVCTPDERYLANDRNLSQWVSMANWREASPNSLFTFRTRFELDGYDLSTIQLFGRFLADNGIQGVRVNGVPATVESWIDNESYQEFDHSRFRFVNVTEGLRAGTNVIEIDVWNGIFQEPAEWRGDPNPMALRVEWYAFGRQINTLEN